MAEGQLTTGTSTTITLAVADRISVDCQQGASALLYSGTAPSTNLMGSMLLARTSGGRAVWGPYGSGTVVLGAVGGTVDWQSGTESQLQAGLSINGVVRLTANQIAVPSATVLADRYTRYIGPNGEQLYSDGVGLRLSELRGANTAAVSGTAAITVANLIAGNLVFTGGAGTQTLPNAAAIVAVNGAAQGTQMQFSIDNTAGSGTCTLAVNTGIVAATPIITGGATLTVANSATQGIGLFRLVFSSASAAVLFRIG
jgi:hypothetical protein